MPCLFKVLSWDFSNLVTSSSFSSNLVLFYSQHIYSYFLHWILNPSKSYVRVGINFPTWVNVSILTSSSESWMFLMASRIVNPLRRFSIDFAQVLQRNHCFENWSHLFIERGKTWETSGQNVPMYVIPRFKITKSLQ